MAEQAHGTTEPRGLAERALTASSSTQGRFGRMFRRLPVFEPSDKFLKELAGEMVDRGRTKSADNPDIPAGYTYLGQFIDHDITFDNASSLERQNDPDGLRNFRTPRFDLDSLYGRGPSGSPELYDRRSPAKLLVGKNPKEDDDGFALERRDLPRNNQGVAIIGDPRNDENVIVSQLHLTFIDFHNKVVDLVARDPEFDEPKEIFKEANRLVRWHYQWVVIHDFLKRIVTAKRVDDRLTPDQPSKVKLRFYHPKNTPFMPVEFSVAAYRFGHSQIRPTYSINDLVQDVPIFSATKRAHPLEDFRGFRPLPEAWTVDWSFFFKLARRRPQPTRKIDTRLAEGLTTLPGERGEKRNLALRNLKRGVALGLPSGSAVAKAIGADVLTLKQLGIEHRAPLWYYVLREAAVQANGKRLGQVGANIVVEVFLGLLDGDPLSYLSVEPGWTPTLPSEKPGEFTMADLIRFAQS